MLSMSPGLSYLTFPITLCDIYFLPFPDDVIVGGGEGVQQQFQNFNQLN